jgi:hypothetical protein
MKFEDFSPAAGILSGEGLMGKIAASGAMGLLPRHIARDAQAEDEEKKKQQSGMKKGGKVSSASKRADGCAVRGKTKGKMV